LGAALWRRVRSGTTARTAERKNKNAKAVSSHRTPNETAGCFEPPVLSKITGEPSPSPVAPARVDDCKLALMTAPWLKPPQPNDWRRSIGMFSGDEVMKRIDDAALAYRQADRERFYREFDQQQQQLPVPPATW
jgi:hypothetical protein